MAPPRNAKRDAGQKASASSSSIPSIQEHGSDNEHIQKPEPATTAIQPLEVSPLFRAEQVPAAFLGELRKAIREEGM